MDRRRLGGYEIVNEVGRGGMAVVYKAWQPSLERFVALKVLPEYFGHDPQFLARFQREARMAARFNHPNIVYVFDVGEDDGIHYIAMEYLEGGSLRDRLAGAPFSLKESQSILRQVASGLDYAHSRGLIHRDIKPGNILFTEDGRPKVADFGIARPTGESRLTQTGVLMGTPEYMAPEQAEGKSVDHRADLYALGVVLYQMLTGRVPFRRTTPHATIHAVIYEPPTPPRQVIPGLAKSIEDVVLRALAKRPQDRYQRGADIVTALKAAVVGNRAQVAAPMPVPRPTPARPNRMLIWAMAGAALVLVLLLTLLLVWLLRGGRDGAPVAQVSGTPTSPALAAQADTPLPPSATKPAVPTQPPGSPSVAPEFTPLPTPADATGPPPTVAPLPPSPSPPPPTAKADPFFGRLAFSSNRHGNNEIYIVRLSAGTPKRLTNNSADDWLPDWSPDGDRIAFTSNRTGSYDLWSMDGSGGGATALVATGAWDDYPRWGPAGGRLGFSTTAMTEGVPNSEIHIRRAAGALVQLTHSMAEDQWPDWSPDGRIIYSEGWKGTANWDILIMDADGGGRSVWLSGPTCDVQGTWSPDGKSIAFLRIERDTNGNGQVDELDAGDVWVGKAAGGGLLRLTSGVWATTPAWSPDSRWISFTQLRDSNGSGWSDADDASDIRAVPAAGGPSLPLVESPHRDGDPSWTE